MAPFRIVHVLSLATLCPALSYAAGLPEFTLPVQCFLGQNCFIQNYQDHDPTSEARDYNCGQRTYDTHNGTDFRIQDMLVQKKGVSVLSIADGVIDRLRDGMQDISVRITGMDAIKQQQCGNGVVINHAEGWTSQYCHMAKGSIIVRPGDRVTAGQPIGQIGLSGNTEFPHLHLTIRKNGEVVDPFNYDNGACGTSHSLWETSLASPLQYRRGEIMNAGFTSIPVSMESIEQGEVGNHPLKRNFPVFVYVRAIGLEKGDIQTLEINSPSRDRIAATVFEPLNANKAQLFVSIGINRSGRKLPLGEYRALYVVKRDGTEILRRQISAELAD